MGASHLQRIAHKRELSFATEIFPKKATQARGTQPLNRSDQSQELGKWGLQRSKDQHIAFPKLAPEGAAGRPSATRSRSRRTSSRTHRVKKYIAILHYLGPPVERLE